MTTDITENITDETADVDELTYQVEVLVEIKLPRSGDEEADFVEAVKVVDNTLQRAWDTDQSRHHVQDWQFEIFGDGVRVLDRRPAQTSVRSGSTGSAGAGCLPGRRQCQPEQHYWPCPLSEGLPAV